MSLQRFEFPMSCSAGKSNFECWGVILPTNGVAVKLKELAEFLEYDNVKMAYKLIPEEWKMTWNEVQNTMVSNRDHLVTSSELPSNWHPETLFVLEPGVYALLARSNKPMAKQMMRFVYETILPTIRRTGKFDIKDHNGEKSVEPYDSNVADLKVKLLEERLEHQSIVSKYDTTIANFNTTISEMKRNYEHQMSEYKEREYKMQLQMKDMANAANTTMTQFAVNALLAKDNIEENQQMRQTLTNVSGRVVPEMKEQPHKEEYITGYERMVNGKRRIRMCRSQLHEIEQQDKAIQRYSDKSTSYENKRAKMSNSKRYAWLRDSEKFLQLQCPNPVMVWLKVRTNQPHMFYGLRYTNKLKTEMEVLNEEELRSKYRADAAMCERNKHTHTKLIEEFKELKLTDEDDCVSRCFTPSVEVKERINAIVEIIVENMNKDLVPETPQRKHSNAGETYTAEQVVHTMNNCQNYFVKNVFNINYYSAAVTPAITM
jgi:prophage antirepressor-like protein